MSVVPMLNTWMAKSRTVTISTAGVIAIDDVTSGSFRAGVFLPREPVTNESDGAPRANAPRTIVWYPAEGLLSAVPTVRPGDRLLDDEDEYEVLGGPGNRRAGVRTIVYELEVLPTRLLYPILGDVLRQDGTILQAGIRLALYPTGGERVAGHGEYQDYTAEAPVEYAAHLAEPNCQLAVGAARYRVSEATVHRQQPHVEMAVTRL